MNKEYRFNFESQYEEKQYDRLVKICKAPIAFIEENIEHYDLEKYSVTELAKRLENEYSEYMKGG